MYHSCDITTPLRARHLGDGRLVGGLPFTYRSLLKSAVQAVHGGQLTIGTGIILMLYCRFPRNGGLRK